MAMKMRGWCSNILTLLITIIIFIVILEVVVRVLIPSCDGFWQHDPDLGITFRPSIEARCRSNEYDSSFTTNDLGFRGNNPIHSKSTIMVLGDSFTEAVQVNDEDIYLNTLKNAQVLNFGISSYGTVQHIVTLQKYGESIKPDLVVLAFFEGNDISDNYKPLAERFSQPQKPFLIKTDGGYQITPVDSSWNFQNKVRRILSRHVKLAVVLREAVARLQSNTMEVSIADIFKPTYDDNWQAAWEITAEAITLVAKESENLNAEFLILIIPSDLHINPENYEAFIDTSILDLNRVENLVLDLAEENDYRVITVSTELKNSNKKLYFDKDKHFTPSAHKIVGEKLQTYIEENNLI